VKIASPLPQEVDKIDLDLGSPGVGGTEEQSLQMTSSTEVTFEHVTTVSPIAMGPPSPKSWMSTRFLHWLSG
jgi:hypothetical protein